MPTQSPLYLVDTEPTSWLSNQLTTSTVRQVPISSLNLDFTLRIGPVDFEHVQILAGVVEQLPPILVEESSSRVIDGVHRVHAALAQGREFISAVLYNGSHEDAFAVAVRLNTSHGLPLSRAERSAAARRLLLTHPQWSNRMIAGMTGLSEATVRTRRAELARPGPESALRIGQDGRVRPVNVAEGRVRVTQLLAERPTASARRIAQEAGVSTNTVLDVRRKLADGPTVMSVRSPDEPQPQPPAVNSPKVLSDLGKNTEMILGNLMADPSIRLSDRGRFLLRWMRVNWEALNSGAEVVDAIPDHWSSPVAKLARGYAGLWQELARQLEYRAEEPGTRTASWPDTRPQPNSK